MCPSRRYLQYLARKHWTAGDDMSEHHLERAAAILRSTRYATIATASRDGKPWNSPVAHEFDDQLNVYWFSDKQNQHSQNVRENADVFIVIYDSSAPETDAEGVYIEAVAVELTDPDEVLRVRKMKANEDWEGNPDDCTGDAIRRVYKAVPHRVWMNDAELSDGAYVRDYRVEIPLDRLREHLGS